MSIHPEILIQRIEEAFAGVRLREGVSFRETEIIDDYGSEAARKAARAQDEKEDWKKIPNALIGSLPYQSAMSFFDAKGWHFHIPAVMRFSLLEGERTDSAIVEGLIFTLSTVRCMKALYPLLTEAQKEAILLFLQYFSKTSAYWQDPQIQAGISMWKNVDLPP